jgi:hypothetical protein
MAIALYFDHHVPRAIASGLRVRAVDVLTADEDGASELPDPELLDRAGQLGRVLYSQDRHLLAEANRRQAAGITFGGLIFAHPLRISMGAAIRNLELIAKATDLDDHRDQVTFLPL